jgi:hypothetical protein
MKNTLTSSDAVAYRVQRCGHRFRRPRSAYHVGASLGHGHDQQDRRRDDQDDAQRQCAACKALVHGYASAAGLALLDLHAGAVVATSIHARTDSLLGGVHP